MYTNSAVNTIIIWLRSHGIEPALWVMSPTCCHHTRPQLFFYNPCTQYTSKHCCHFTFNYQIHLKSIKLDSRCIRGHMIDITIWYLNNCRFIPRHYLGYLTSDKEWNLSWHPLFINMVLSAVIETAILSYQDSVIPLNYKSKKE